MIKNAYVTIIFSPELSQMRLDELIGRRGMVYGRRGPLTKQGDKLWRSCTVGRNLYG